MYCKAAWDVGKRRATAKIEMRMYVLEAMNGPLDGKRWEFDKNIIIGRDASAAAAALPVDHAVSRVHARIDIEHSRLSIVDLGSSNGTILGGEPISSAANLDIGSPFIVGRTMLRVLREGTAHSDNDSVH
jgi:pSer/pThr/pTyr-binding forkhead associated (FHA) protein